MVQSYPRGEGLARVVDNLRIISAPNISTDEIEHQPDVQVTFSQRHISLADIKRTILGARENLKEGRLGQKRGQRIVNLHRGILLVRFCNTMATVQRLI